MIRAMVFSRLQQWCGVSLWICRQSKIKGEMQFHHSILVALLIGASAVGQQVPANQQSNSDSAQPDAKQQQQNGKPSSEDANPFPEATSKKAQEAANGAPTTDAKSSQQENGKRSPADANPFPEAMSKKAEDAANGASTPDAKSGQPGSSSSHVDMKRFDTPADGESRISDGVGGYIHSPELAAKDDKVGKFYLQNGDYKGAYDRYKEATKVAPEDEDAVFGLAESARALHLNEEAASNYTLYLDAFPDGRKAKEARKELAALKTSSKK